MKRVKSVTKTENGGLVVVLHGGETYEISKEDELFQVFVVYVSLLDG